MSEYYSPPQCQLDVQYSQALKADGMVNRSLQQVLSSTMANDINTSNNTSTHLSNDTTASSSNDSSSTIDLYAIYHAVRDNVLSAVFNAYHDKSSQDPWFQLGQSNSFLLKVLNRGQNRIIETLSDVISQNQQSMELLELLLKFHFNDMTLTTSSTPFPIITKQRSVTNNTTNTNNNDKTLNTEPTSMILVETINNYCLPKYYKQFMFWSTLFSSGFGTRLQSSGISFQYANFFYLGALIIAAAIFQTIGWNESLPISTELPLIQFSQPQFFNNLDQLTELYLPCLKLRHTSLSIQFQLPTPQNLPQSILNTITGYSNQIPPLNRQSNNVPLSHVVIGYPHILHQRWAIHDQHFTYQDYCYLWLKYAPRLYNDIINVQYEFYQLQLKQQKYNNEHVYQSETTTTPTTTSTTPSLQLRDKIIPSEWPNNGNDYSLLHDSFLVAYLSKSDDIKLDDSLTDNEILYNMKSFTLENYANWFHHQMKIAATSFDINQYQNTIDIDNNNNNIEHEPFIPQMETFPNILYSLEYAPRLSQKQLSSSYFGSFNDTSRTISWPEFYITMFNESLDECCTFIHGYSIIDEDTHETIDLIYPSDKFIHDGAIIIPSHSQEYIIGPTRSFIIEFSNTTRQIETLLLAILHHAPSTILMVLFNVIQDKSILLQLQHIVTQKYDDLTTSSKLTFHDYLKIAGTHIYANEFVSHTKSILDLIQCEDNNE